MKRKNILNANYQKENKEVANLMVFVQASTWIMSIPIQIRHFSLIKVNNLLKMNVTQTVVS